MKKSDLFQVGVEYSTPKGKATVQGFEFGDDSITLSKVIMKRKNGRTFKVKPSSIKKIHELSMLRKMIRELVLREIKTNLIYSGLELFDDGIKFRVYDIDGKYVYMKDNEDRPFKIGKKDFEQKKWEIK